MTVMVLRSVTVLDPHTCIDDPLCAAYVVVFDRADAFAHALADCKRLKCSGGGSSESTWEDH